MDYLSAYKGTVAVIGIVGLISLIQLAILDIVSINRKHKPGYPIEPNHKDFLFRASRAHANTNESISVFILFSLFGILSQSNAEWLNNMAIVYLAGRILHMVSYYARQGLIRSLSFGVSLIGLLGMLVVAVKPWLG